MYVYRNSGDVDGQINYVSITSIRKSPLLEDLVPFEMLTSDVVLWFWPE